MTSAKHIFFEVLLSTHLSFCPTLYWTHTRCFKYACHYGYSR